MHDTEWSEGEEEAARREIHVRSRSFVAPNFRVRRNPFPHRRFGDTFLSINSFPGLVSANFSKFCACDDNGNTVSAMSDFRFQKLWGTFSQNKEALIFATL